ncbi:MAG: LamG-like jellyroll fold domain-containing protein [Nitrospira sp.]
MSSVVPFSGLVAAYGFNEGAGTTAADTSGTSSAATLTNVAWTAQGKYGTGLTFDGTSSYGQVPPPATPLRLTTAMTVEVWMNATTLATGWHTLLSRQVGTGGADSWGLFTRGTTVEFWTNSTDFIAAPVTSGTWTHVAGVLDGTAVRLYVNGTLVATGTTTVPIPNDDNEVVMGASSNGNPLISEFFNGTLDEIRVYNRALSQAEIQTDMNTPITATLSGSITTTFVYDGEGGRVKKSVGATTTRYISQLYACENSNCSRSIWAGNTRIAILPDNPTGQPCNPACYFHADHLSSTNLVTGPTGTRVETITYQPYGEVHSDNPGTPVNTPYKYTGQERDASTGLMYYHARYYDPRLGRFISPDSIVPNLRDPQDLNRYTYARNNPMLYTDPSGHCEILCAIGIGILIGVVSSGIETDWDPSATLLGGFIGGVSMGVGYGAYGPAVRAFGFLGDIGSVIAGGTVAGAAAGGTSGALSRAAGYHVNIGLAIASGAAAGGIAAGGYRLGGELGAFIAAPIAGASAAAINGADPGVGALIAAHTAVFALGALEAYKSFTAHVDHQGRPLTNQEIALYKKDFFSRTLDAARIHEGVVPSWLSRNMRGITLETDIYFREGEYIPGTAGGVEILGHELVHVQDFLNGMSYFDYIWASRYGYLENPYEIEAYRKGDEIRMNFCVTNPGTSGC